MNKVEREIAKKLKDILAKLKLVKQLVRRRKHVQKAKKVSE